MLEIANFDVPDSAIPDKVLNAAPPKKKERVPKTKQPSNFLITANPNVSWRDLQNRDQKLKAAKQLIIFGKNVEVNLKNHKLLKQVNTIPDYKFPNVTNYKFAVESGSQKGFLHLHAIVSFDGYCQLRLGPMQQLLNTCMAGISTGGYVNVEYFPNTQELVQQYVNKDQNTIYHT